MAENRRIRAALTAVFGALQDAGVVVIDSAGCVVECTAGAARALGVTNEIIGRRLTESGLDYRAIRLAQLAATSAAAASRELDTDRNLSLTALSYEGMVFLHVRDETRLRRLEQMRRDFVSNVSHELRTPVAAIRLLVETLEAGALEDREAAAGFVRQIGTETTHMARMVEALLQLSALESGEPAQERGPVAVGDLVAAAERLRPLIDDRQLSLEIDLPDGLPAVLGDVTQLGQVIRNLVHNAIKFSPPGGTITLAARGDGDAVEISVRDTGVGIRPDDLPRVFERFWKADSSRQRDGEGAGLGLAIARHAVEAHGGSISAESTPGKGATFTVRLPAAVRSPAA